MPQISLYTFFNIKKCILFLINNYITNQQMLPCQPCILLLLIFPIFSISDIERSVCGCQNGGLCQTNSDMTSYCDCANNFIDKNCTKQAVQLSQHEYIANITQQYTYFFIHFNSTSLFYTQILFCPVKTDPQFIYQVNIDFQQEDGSINNNPSSQSYSFKLQEHQCIVAKYVIFPFKKRNNGELIRLIVQIKSNKAFSQSREDTIVPNQIQLSSSLYEFNKINDEDIGTFLLISMGCSGLLFCITFVICRRLVDRRIRRFVYHPAEAVRDISSFDTTMPSVFYELNETSSAQEKQCMICLLPVQNTYTRLTPCSHLFHKDCIDEWGRKSLTCPTCRSSLVGERVALL